MGYSGTKNKSLNKSLANLLGKYDIAITKGFELIKFTNEKQILHLFPGWKFKRKLGENDIPLFPWRFNRKFIELKKIVVGQTVEDVALMRFSCSSKDHAQWSLKALLYKELDLCEYLGGASIKKYYWVIDDSRASINMILKLANGILCSIEIGMDQPNNFLPALIERHEIIGARGTCSDIVVDTQVPQSSVYVFTEDGMEQYKDIDMELHGHTPSEVDHIRSAFYFYQNLASVEKLKLHHIHLSTIVEDVLKYTAH